MEFEPRAWTDQRGFVSPDSCPADLGRWGAGRFHGNSGTWAPGYLDQHCTRPVFNGRSLLILSTARAASGAGWDRSTASGGLYWWRDGDWVAEPGAVRDPREYERMAGTGSTG